MASFTLGKMGIVLPFVEAWPFRWTLFAGILIENCSLLVIILHRSYRKNEEECIIVEYMYSSRSCFKVIQLSQLTLKLKFCKKGSLDIYCASCL